MGVPVGVGTTAGVCGADTIERTKKNAAIRMAMTTGATTVMGRPVAIEVGRIGALLRASSILRLRGAVAVPVA